MWFLMLAAPCIFDVMHSRGYGESVAVTAGQRSDLLLHGITAIESHRSRAISDPAGMHGLMMRRIPCRRRALPADSIGRRNDERLWSLWVDTRMEWKSIQNKAYA
jgi:hypothetical protein